MAYVRVENLHYRYPAFDPDAALDPDAHWALAGVDLAVEAGQLLGVSGTTGSGKSTLCLALNGLVPQQTSGTIRGDVWVGDWNTKRVPVPQLATRVGLVFQDPEFNLLGLSVEDEVAFGAENLGIDPREIGERVAWSLDVVGMTELRERPAALLSGGQKQRVGVAAVLTMLPRVLVLDEPTAELDPLGKQEIAAVLAELRARERDLTIIMVESDAETLARLADRVAVLDAGRVIALDEPRALYSGPGAAELLARGVPIPQLSELAGCLNRAARWPWPQPLAFLREDEAQATLTAALGTARAARASRT